jgi:hypothetical protein
LPPSRGAHGTSDWRPQLRSAGLPGVNGHGGGVVGACQKQAYLVQRNASRNRERLPETEVGLHPDGVACARPGVIGGGLPRRCAGRYRARRDRHGPQREKDKREPCHQQLSNPQSEPRRSCRIIGKDPAPAAEVNAHRRGDPPILCANNRRIRVGRAMTDAGQRDDTLLPALRADPAALKAKQEGREPKGLRVRQPGRRQAVGVERAQPRAGRGCRASQPEPGRQREPRCPAAVGTEDLAR